MILAVVQWNQRYGTEKGDFNSECIALVSTKDYIEVCRKGCYLVSLRATISQIYNFIFVPQDLEWATQINRITLEICGTWPKTGQPAWRSFFDNSRVLLFAVSIVVFALVPLTLALMRVWGDLNLMIDNLIIYLPYVVTVGKITTLWYRKEVIVTIIESMKSDWIRRKTEDERAVMLRYARIARVITIGGFVVITSTIVVYHPAAILGFALRTMTNLTDTGNGRVFGLQTVYWFDAYRSPYYELTIISQVYVSSVSGFCYTTVGSLFGAIVLHACSQLENLKFRIEGMVTKNADTRDFQKIFKSNVEEHQRLIGFVDLIEKTFSAILLQVVTVFSVTLCIQAFQILYLLSVANPPVLQIGISIVYAMYIVFIMFVYSSVGDELLTQSEALRDAAYNCHWYELSPRQAIQLIPILLQAQKPLKITAGKFFPLSLTTFANLMKTATGYISFLLAIKE